MNEKLMDKPNQIMKLVNSNGKETTETLDRKSCHITPGKKHLAIQVLLFNAGNALILHERPLNKVGNGGLDSPTTHVLAGESSEESARRCLLDEYGISEEIPITVLSGFSYEKDYGDGTCENEFCLAAFAIYEGKINHNEEHTQKVILVPAKKVLEEIKSDKYPVWFKETVRIVSGNEKGKLLFE